MSKFKMTPQEALSILNGTRIMVMDNSTTNPQDYETAMDVAKEVLDEKIARPPIQLPGTEDYCCPSCASKVSNKYCDLCGQKLKWSSDDDDEVTTESEESSLVKIINDWSTHVRMCSSLNAEFINGIKLKDLQEVLEVLRDYNECSGIIKAKRVFDSFWSELTSLGLLKSKDMPTLEEVLEIYNSKNDTINHLTEQLNKMKECDKK